MRPLAKLTSRSFAKSRLSGRLLIMSESLSIAIADRSISSTFQSKQQLFLTVLDRYDERWGEKVLAGLTAAEAGLATPKLFCESLTT